MKTLNKYSSKSKAISSGQETNFLLSSDLNRPPVHVDAEIKNGLDFSDAMLALREVVISDKRSVKKDHSKYQAWVFQEYLKELNKSQPDSIKEIEANRKKIIRELNNLGKKIKNNPLTVEDSDFYKAQRKFWDWLYNEDKDLWYILDPVISVQPECIIFEAFSLDESSYGRVTLPKRMLSKSKKYTIGTTNIDFSRNLANEFSRVRSYRPLNLKIGQNNVIASTEISENIEKKIDLPQTWVNGFLEVQTASTLNHLNFDLTPDFVSDIIAFLEQHKNNVSPKSLKIKLQNNKKPIFEIEPWGKKLEEHNYIYYGPDKEIRLWGRSRLSILKNILKKTDKVSVSAIDDGMPSFWSCKLNDVTFDLCLSGWTANDWSSQLKFALMSADPKRIIFDNECELLNEIRNLLNKKIKLSISEITKKVNCQEKDALACLQKLCSDGLVMYDFHTKEYRWRELFNSGDKLIKKVTNKNLVKGLSIDPNLIKARITNLPEGQRNITWVYDKKIFGWPRLSRAQIILDNKDNFIQTDCDCFDFKKTFKKEGPCKHLIALMNKYIWERYEN